VRHAISLAAFRTTQTANGRGYSGHEVAIFEGRSLGARFVMRRPEKAT